MASDATARFTSFTEMGPTPSRTIFIFASSTFRLLMAPAIASAEPFVSVLIMRFTEGLAESPAPAKIPSKLTTPFLANLLSLLLLALSSDKFFAAFSSFTTMNSCPAFGGYSRPDIATGDDGGEFLICEPKKFLRLLIFLY